MVDIFLCSSWIGRSLVRGFSFLCFLVSFFSEEQLIRTNSTNILIRSLQLNKQRSEGKDGKAKAVSESNRGKR